MVTRDQDGIRAAVRATPVLSAQDVLAVPETNGIHLYVTSQATIGYIDILTIPYPGQPTPDDVGFSPDGRALLENVAGKCRSGWVPVTSG